MCPVRLCRVVSLSYKRKTDAELQKKCEPGKRLCLLAVATAPVGTDQTTLCIMSATIDYCPTPAMRDEVCILGRVTPSNPPGSAMR